MWGYPPTPYLPECMSLHMYMRLTEQLSLFTIRLKIFEIFTRLKNPQNKITDIYFVGNRISVREFFRRAPPHQLQVGDLVTCSCHGGIAVILEIYDGDTREDYMSMDMCKIFWIKYPHKGVKERIWMHTISRLYLFKGNKRLEYVDYG